MALMGRFLVCLRSSGRQSDRCPKSTAAESRVRRLGTARDQAQQAKRALTHGVAAKLRDADDGEYNRYHDRACYVTKQGIDNPDANWDAERSEDGAC